MRFIQRISALQSALWRKRALRGCAPLTSSSTALSTVSVVCALWTVHCRAVSAVSHSLSLTDPASVAVGHEVELDLEDMLEDRPHTIHRAQHSAHTNCIQILCMHRATLVTFATTTHREAPSFHWRHASILQIRESHAQVMTQVHVTMLVSAAAVQGR